MMGSIGLPELILIIVVALTVAVWPVLFFGIGYYFGRRSVLRNAGVPPAGPAASSPPAHV
jgi:hypothetical protein